jgi:hypothetical protein
MVWFRKDLSVLYLLKIVARQGPGKLLVCACVFGKYYIFIFCLDGYCLLHEFGHIGSYLLILLDNQPANNLSKKMLAFFGYWYGFQYIYIYIENCM